MSAGQTAAYAALKGSFLPPGSASRAESRAAFSRACLPAADFPANMYEASGVRPAQKNCCSFVQQSFYQS